MISLPNLPNCRKLSCYNNQLNILPDLPNCRGLVCGNNQLISLPNLPNCEALLCSENQLTILPNLSKCKMLYCDDNQLINKNVDFWIKFNQVKSKIIGKRIIKRWKRYVIKMKIPEQLKIDIEYHPMTSRIREMIWEISQ